MRIMILAGEESGRIYGKALRDRLPGHEVRGYEYYGFKTADLAVMGFAAVVRRLPFFLKVKRTIEREIREWKPDVVCTIDYPGMNLKLAAYAKARGVRTVHVVCPQVWAWKKGRVPKIEAAVDHLCCFFPFEPALFRPGFATFIGHPLVESFASLKRTPLGGEGKLVALLPGSRLGEIARILPTMLAALGLLENVRAVIPAAHARAKQAIERVLAATPGAPKVDVRLGGARELLLSADCAIVASGTATLEAALARCPTVLVYKVDPFLAWFARRVIKEISHIGLVNVVWEKMGREGPEPMPELLQGAFTPLATASLLKRWLTDESAHAAAVSALDGIVRKLETDGDSLSRIVDALGVHEAPHL